jgi:pimeloyl-ACP methyl ester carboxylesterase
MLKFQPVDFSANRLAGVPMRRFLIFSVVCSIVSRVAAGQSVQMPLWEGLTPGPHQVGFKSFWRRDWSRGWTSPLDAKGRQTGVVARPVRINLWYPAAESRIPNMRFADYIGSANTPGFEKVEDMVKRADLGQAGEKGLLNIFSSKDAVESLFTTRVAAHRDAPPASGRFPLIVYALGQGDYTEENIPLCEYLASRGYVIVSVAQLGTSERRDVLFIHDKPSYDAEVQDLGFALATTLREISSADSNRVGAIGMSMGGVYSLLLALRTPIIRVVVGLDPSYVSTMASFAYRYSEAPEFDPAAFRGRVLTIYRQDSTPRTRVVDSLYYADRTFSRIPFSVHTDFTGYPAYARRVPLAAQDSFALAHRSPGKAAASYVNWVNYLACYLDRALARNASKIDCARPPGAENEIVPALTGLTEEDLYTLMRQYGLPSALSALSDRTAHPDAWHLRRPTMRHVVNELGYAGRPLESAQYAELLAAAFGDAESYEQLGDAWAEAGDVARARTAYSRAFANDSTRVSARTKLNGLTKKN